MSISIYILYTRVLILINDAAYYNYHLSIFTLSNRSPSQSINLTFGETKIEDLLNHYKYYLYSKRGLRLKGSISTSTAFVNYPFQSWGWVHISDLNFLAHAYYYRRIAVDLCFLIMTDFNVDIFNNTNNYLANSFDCVNVVNTSPLKFSNYIQI